MPTSNRQPISVEEYAYQIDELMRRNPFGSMTIPPEEYTRSTVQSQNRDDEGRNILREFVSTTTSLDSGQPYRISNPGRSTSRPVPNRPTRMESVEEVKSTREEEYQKGYEAGYKAAIKELNI